MATEKRLIDANKLSEQMAANFEQCVYDGVDSAECQIALDTISEAPTVDAVEVVHGRWVKKTTDCVYYYACSECGEPVLRSKWGNDFFSNYCPNCGAKMDLEAT